MRAGATKREITPPVGTDLSGYIRRFGSSTGIHDPLWASILWVESGNKQILFISLDVMNFSQEFSSRAKEVITEETNIPEDSILIAAIHTHSAPGIHLFRDGSKKDDKWEERILDSLVDGSKEARQQSKRALLGMGTGQVSIGYNRSKSGGAVDPYLTLAGFFHEDRRLFSLIANYGCHPVVLAEDNLLISADYAGFFRDQLCRSFSSDITTLFFTGAGGDVDPIKRGSFEIARRLALVLSVEAQRVIERMKLHSDAEIKTGKTTLEIPYQWIPSSDEAEKTFQESRTAYRDAMKKGDKKEEKIRKAFLLWADDLRKSVIEGKLSDSLECELQCIRLGKAVFLAFPFELFSTIALELRKLSKIEDLFPVGYANGYHGYLADEGAFQEKGYETDEAFKYTGLLPLSPRAGNIFLEKARALLKRMG